MHVFISSLFQLSFWFVFKVVAVFVNLHAYSQLSEADIELHLLRHKNLPKVLPLNNICEIPDISKFVPLVGLLARPPSILCWVILFSDTNHDHDHAGRLAFQNGPGRHFIFKLMTDYSPAACSPNHH